MVVGEVRREDTPQVPLIQDDQVVETLPAHRADQPCHVGILPWPEIARSISGGTLRPAAAPRRLVPACCGLGRRVREMRREMARPAGLEPATPGLEEQWCYSEAAFLPATCGSTHPNYPRGIIRLLDFSASHRRRVLRYFESLRPFAYAAPTVPLYNGNW
jgi:hypothetical protein